jgi:hypothetical protein
METHAGAREAHPGAMKTHHGLGLILQPWRLTLEPMEAYSKVVALIMQLYIEDTDANSGVMKTQLEGRL